MGVHVCPGCECLGTNVALVPDSLVLLLVMALHIFLWPRSVVASWPLALRPFCFVCVVPPNVQS